MSLNLLINMRAIEEIFVDFIFKNNKKKYLFAKATLRDFEAVLNKVKEEKKKIDR